MLPCVWLSDFAGASTQSSPGRTGCQTGRPSPSSLAATGVRLLALHFTNHMAVPCNLLHLLLALTAACCTDPYTNDATFALSMVFLEEMGATGVCGCVHARVLC